MPKGFEFWQVVDAVLKGAGIKAARLAGYLQCQPSTITGWSERKDFPDSEAAAKFRRLLGFVTDDDFKSEVLIGGSLKRLDFREIARRVLEGERSESGDSVQHQNTLVKLATGPKPETVAILRGLPKRTVLAAARALLERALELEDGKSDGT